MVSGWRRQSAFPLYDGEGWAVWKRRQIRCADVKDVAHQIKGWNPLQPLLVGAPGSSHFAPPPAIKELDGTIRAFRKRSFFGILAFLIGSFVFLAISLSMPEKGRAPIYVITMLVTLTMAIDYAVNLRRIEPLLERSQFFFWLQASNQGRVGFLVWLTIGTSAGLFQLIVQHYCQSFDSMIETYGLMFQPALGGEFWRFLVGPFFHSGVGHYLNNAISLLFVGSVAWALFGFASVAVFLAGTWLSSVVQALIGSASFDSYLGISGGVFAMYGLVIAAGLVDRKLLPQGFVLLCACVAVITGVGAALLSANTASVAHASGVVIGSLCALLVVRGTSK